MGKAWMFSVALAGALGCQAAEPAATKAPRAPVSLRWVTVGKELGARRVFDKTLAQAKKDRRPVFVDFRADWCVACNELDKHVFTQGPVKAALSKFVLVRVDATEETADIMALMKRYSVLSLPTLMVIDAGGQVQKDARIESYVEADELLAALAKL